MQKAVELGVTVRTQSGSSYARNLRRGGRVPAILYGHGMQPLTLEVNTRELNKALNTKAGENVILQLKAEGANLKESTCVIKEIQHDPVTEAIQHVDFTVVSLTEKIEVNVPLIIKNSDDSAGVKAGGILDVVHHEIAVICTPLNIPEAFTIDVKNLNMNDAIYVKDLKIPEGVEINLDELELDDVVVAVHPPKMEKTETEEETGTQPEVIEKGKKPAEGEEAAVSEKKPEAKKEQK